MHTLFPFAYWFNLHAKHDFEMKNLSTSNLILESPLSLTDCCYSQHKNTNPPKRHLHKNSVTIIECSRVYVMCHSPYFLECRMSSMIFIRIVWHLLYLSMHSNKSKELRETPIPNMSNNIFNFEHGDCSVVLTIPLFLCLSIVILSDL